MQGASRGGGEFTPKLIERFPGAGRLLGRPMSYESVGGGTRSFAKGQSAERRAQRAEREVVCGQGGSEGGEECWGVRWLARCLQLLRGASGVAWL